MAPSADHTRHSRGRERIVAEGSAPRRIRPVATRARTRGAGGGPPPHARGPRGGGRGGGPPPHTPPATPGDGRGSWRRGRRLGASVPWLPARERGAPAGIRPCTPEAGGGGEGVGGVGQEGGGEGAAGHDQHDGLRDPV